MESAPIRDDPPMPPVPARTFPVYDSTRQSPVLHFPRSIVDENYGSRGSHPEIRFLPYRRRQSSVAADGRPGFPASGKWSRCPIIDGTRRAAGGNRCFYDRKRFRTGSRFSRIQRAPKPQLPVEAGSGFDRMCVSDPVAYY